MHANQLHINLSKCGHMYFRPNLNYKERMKCARSECYDPTLTLSVNGQKVKQVYKIKFLGVIIDDQLSWNDQIKYVENKLKSTIVLIKRIKKFIPTSHYFKINHSLFISHLTYGISCWGGIFPSELIKMFNIQKRCVRILFGNNYSFDHVLELEHTWITPHSKIIVLNILNLYLTSTNFLHLIISMY